MAEMKRIYFCILIFGFIYGGIKSAYAETSLSLSNSADVQISATVINPVGFVSRISEKQAQLTGRAIELNSSHEISVYTGVNTLLEIENGQRKFYLISSKDIGCETGNDNILCFDITPLISGAFLIQTITDSSQYLITLITISD